MTSSTLGVFGGSFDPVHLGHLHSMWELQLHLSLDTIHFIPCAQSPLKQQSLASAEHRIAMLKLAIRGQPKWQVDDREIQRQGASYTIDTLKSLKQDFPQHNLCLIFSMDVAVDLPKWHKWEELFDYANIIILSRPEFLLPEASWVQDLKKRTLANSSELRTKKSGGVWWQTTTALNISATEIRNLCKKQQPPPYLLQHDVWQYIQQHKIYTE